MTRDSLRQLPIPLFLFLCLVMGGSAQSVWGVLILQLLAISIIAWAVMSERGVGSSGSGLLLAVIASLVLIAIQVVPLPPQMWSSLPGRDEIERGYELLEQQLPWQPISLEPHATLGTLLYLLPSIAIIVGVLRLQAYNESWVAAALFTGTMAGILLGYVQVVTGQFGYSAWYLYEITNVGSAVGFFANRNHMGTLLLMTLPFVVALAFAHRDAGSKHASRTIIGVAGLAAILLGLAANGSLAAIALAVPVVAASAALLPGMRRARAALLTGTAISLLAALVYLASSPVQPKLTGESTASFTSRWDIWEKTVALLQKSFPVGTGFGSFESIYAMGESPTSVTRTYVNNAHNDYLELLLEGGLAGAILLFAFFAWWTKQAARALSSPTESRTAAAATIASGVVLAHSAVDYPLRTTAIAAVFAFCVAVMAAGRKQREPARVGASAARHLRIG